MKFGFKGLISFNLLFLWMLVFFNTCTYVVCFILFFEPYAWLLGLLRMRKECKLCGEIRMTRKIVL